MLLGLTVIGTLFFLLAMARVLLGEWRAATLRVYAEATPRQGPGQQESLGNNSQLISSLTTRRSLNQLLSWRSHTILWKLSCSIWIRALQSHSFPKARPSGTS